MKQYFYHFLDRSNRICRPPMIGNCHDDKAALDSAARLVDTGAIEVWDGERLVGRLEPNMRRTYVGPYGFRSLARPPAMADATRA